MNTNLVERNENSNYPVSAFKEAILKMVEENQVSIISAETGAGKSTQVPQYLLEAGYEKVIVTVPSRTAAASLCDRVAFELNSDVGDLVGFQTGYEKAFSENTRILYTTEGLELMKELHQRNNYDNLVLILDELQEWSINVETLVAWIYKRINIGWNIKVVLMSATMDVTGISEFFGKIPVLTIPGHLFEITEYERGSKDFTNSIYELASQNHNVLAFVPGKREIDQTIAELQAMKLDAVLLRLHGDLPLGEQQVVFREAEKTKVIIATNIAQTSITIPDIDAVVDSGLERHMENVDGLDTLTIGQISRSDHIQRKGRAGRTKPGIYIWCSDASLHELKPYPTPDIFTGSIHQIILKLASIGLDASEVKFFHQPPIEKILATQKTLRTLGAFDCDNKITECGKVMAQLPISVRYARMIVEAQKRDVLSDVVTIASLAEFGGIKTSNVSYASFSREMKSDLLAELDCFYAVKSKLIAGDPNPFEGVIERNYYRANELRVKIADILFNIYGEVSTSGNRAEIRKACAAGLVEFLYVRQTNGWYANPNDSFKRKLNLYSATLPSKFLLGLPKNISLAYKGNSGNQMLYLISYAVMADIPLLEDVAPHLIHTEVKNEFRYDTNEYLIRTVTLFGDVEISSFERKLNDIDEKRNVLSSWLAELTLDEEYFIKYYVDKALTKVIDKNHYMFNTFEEARDFYSQKLTEFSKNSLPNLKKCKSLSFLLR